MSGMGLAGISSGVDTNAIVDQLMAIERNKIARQNVRSKVVEAEAGNLRDIQGKLNALKSAAGALRAPDLWKSTQAIESSDAGRIGVKLTGMAPAGGHSISVRQLAGAEQEGFTFTRAETAGELTVGGRTVAIPANATSAELAAKINGADDLSVYATALDDDTIVFSSRRTGTAGAFDVAGSQLVEDPAHTRLARDAEYSLDGGTTWRPSSSNVVTDAVPGVTLTLKGVTLEGATINVGVAGLDKAAVKGKVKAFVDAYNDVVTNTRAKLTEKSVPNAQNSFEASRGTLFGDSGLSSMLSRMRVMVSDVVAGVGDSGMNELREMGISTGKATGATSENAKIGKLVLDDTQFEAALADPTRLRALLGASGTSGFAQKIEGLIDAEAGKEGVLAGRLRVNADEARRVKDRMADIEDRIAAQEKRLRAQFAAMEKAMGLAQAQGSWLSSQIATLPSAA